MTSLPCGWKYAVIDDILPARGIFKDGDWVESKDQDPNGNIRLIQLADIGDGYFVNKSSRFLTKEKALELRCTFLEKGDLLVARMPDPLGRCCIFPFDRRESYVTVVDICVIRLKDDSIDHKYLMYLINSPAIRTVIEEYKTGSTRKRISRGNFAKVDLPIAPLNEQHRIVAKIEELFSEIDKGVESLKIAKAQLHVYRQALLKHAFEGKLTAQWRSDNPDKVVPAEELLRSIEQSREERYQQQLTDWQTAVEKWEFNGKEGKSPNKPRKNKLEDKIDSSPYFLPPGWLWLQLGNSNVHISDGPFGSNLKTEDYVEEGIRLIRLENIGRGFFIGEKKTHITLAKYEYLKKHSLQPSDLVLSSFITDLIRVAEIPSDLKISINKSDCFQIRLFGNTIDVKYLLYGLQINSVYKQLEKFVHGVGRPRINTTQLKNVQIPVCSPEEQQELVKLLNAAMSYINATEKSIEADLNKAEMLRQSILKKAFSGQLVPQDPTDEPASELLKRIQAEKSDRETATKKQKVKTSK